MSQHKTTKHAAARQAQDIERASWFARLAFGDWANTQVPAPRKRPATTFHVVP